MQIILIKTKLNIVLGLWKQSLVFISVLAIFMACVKQSKVNNSQPLTDGGMRIGWGMADITPNDSANLFGQYYDRYSKYVQSPLKVTACAIESTNEDGSKEQAIMVSMDLLCPTQWLMDSVRGRLTKQIPDFDAKKLSMNATHTHSAPNPYDEKYREVCLDQAGKAAVEAWKNRKPAGISRAMGYAVTGHNRRVEYANGPTEMYGRTDRPDFVGMEGGNNPGVDMLFTWDLNKKLTGVIMDVACPAQVTEAKYYVSADYWGELRKEIAKQYSPGVFILPLCSAAGDLSPRDLPRGYKSGEPNMWDVPGIEEIGKRLIHAINVAYPQALDSIRTKVPFKHVVEELEIPARMYTKMEYDDAVKVSGEIHSREPKDPNSPETAWNSFLKQMHDNEKIKEFGPWDCKETDFGIVKKRDAIIEQYKIQDKHPLYPVELHVIRLGDVAIATNPFELYIDYGFRIMGRSNAKQTFLVQLSSGDYGDYLPTQRAINGGGYSAITSAVGPEGGKVLVDETVKVVNGMW